MDAYPLEWPDGWARHKGERDNDRRFRGPTYQWDRIVRGLTEELQRIGAKKDSIVISTNQPVRRDGYPYAQERVIRDPGVAIYFMRDKRAMVMAQDRFNTVIGNMRSLTMAIEGLRQMERHGGASMMERAFTGFLAITPPDWKKPWREVLGFKPDDRVDAAKLRSAFLAKAKERHPDNGGDDTLMAELNVAFEEANREIAA